MQKTSYKWIDWAYPTSAKPSRFGFSKTGCWVVNVGDMFNPPKAVAGFATKQDAFIHADSLSNPWDANFARRSPEFFAEFNK